MPESENKLKQISAKKKAVFLDRDGVLNRRAPEHDYIRCISDFHILPGVPEAISRLNLAGLLVFVITNQRGIARKLVSEYEVEEMHDQLRTAVQEASGRIEKIYTCPHDYSEKCNCRKPSPGLLIQAQREYGIDLLNSWMIGDSPSDVESGKRAGCHTVLITPTPARELSAPPPDFYAVSLLDAVNNIVLCC